MLLVKKCNFFHYFFSAKIRLKTRFNNVLDRKETFSASKVSKIAYFQRGLTHAFGKKKCFCFHYLFSPKMRLELRFNNILKRKQTLFF